MDGSDRELLALTTDRPSDMDVASTVQTSPPPARQARNGVPTSSYSGTATGRMTIGADILQSPIVRPVLAPTKPAAATPMLDIGLLDRTRWDDPKHSRYNHEASYLMNAWSDRIEQEMKAAKARRLKAATAPVPSDIQPLLFAQDDPGLSDEAVSAPSWNTGTGTVGVTKPDDVLSIEAPQPGVQPGPQARKPGVAQPKNPGTPSPAAGPAPALGKDAHFHKYGIEDHADRVVIRVKRLPNGELAPETMQAILVAAVKFKQFENLHIRVNGAPDLTLERQASAMLPDLYASNVLPQTVNAKVVAAAGGVAAQAFHKTQPGRIERMASAVGGTLFSRFRQAPSAPAVQPG